MGERHFHFDLPPKLSIIRRVIGRFLPIFLAILGLTVAAAATDRPAAAHPQLKLLPGTELMFSIAPRPTAPAAPQYATVEMLVTAYCPCKICCGPNAHGITASGRPVSFNDGHFIAADTNLLPFGSKLIIPGYDNGEAVPVIDRGGAIVGNHIDVFFPQHQEAVDWGRRWVRVMIVSR